MDDLARQIEEATRVVRRTWNGAPRVGIVLGSGLGRVAKRISGEAEFRYENLPHFGRSTAIGHRGRLLCGRFGDTSVVTMQGRFHGYEGYSGRQITFPLRVMRGLGIEVFIVTNAAGGLNPGYRVGDIMVIDDHLNLQGRNPLVGANDDRLGLRFPDISRAYDRQLAEGALAIARREGIVCHRGVYAAVLGPNYETRAEIRMLRRLGADAVGMSTVPEVIAAVHGGLRVLGLSTITNVCSPDVAHQASGEAVIAEAARVGEKVGTMIEAIVGSLGGAV